MKQALHFLHKKRCFLHKIHEAVYGFLFAQAVCVARLLTPFVWLVCAVLAAFSAFYVLHLRTAFFRVYLFCIAYIVCFLRGLLRVFCTVYRLFMFYMFA